MKLTLKVLMTFGLVLPMAACGEFSTEAQDSQLRDVVSKSDALSVESLPSELSSVTCTNWSEWSSTGVQECYITAGACHSSWICDYDVGSLAFIPRETEKCPGHYEPGPGTRRQDYRIRQCFDANGSALPIERETRWVLLR